MTSNYGVAVRFAENEMPKGGELWGSHFFLRDGVLYSYGEHFPVAMWLDYPKLLLWNSDGYSNTTAKQKSRAWSAISKSFPSVEQVKVETREFQDILSQRRSSSSGVVFVVRSFEPEKLTFLDLGRILPAFLKHQGINTRTANKLVNEALDAWKRKAMMEVL